MILASTTGTSATNRGEAMLRNAIYGIAAAKALGIEEPTVGVLNVDTAQPVFRALSRLAERGYGVKFGSSVRQDGGAVLRGNDILAGAVDVCVTDTLTGNVLMKMFSAFNTGGSYEATGWGYGPSCGEGWKDVVSIISRASGAAVIAGALSFTASAV
jgi:betaine reductase